jgi:hypothetical protein
MTVMAAVVQQIVRPKPLALPAPNDSTIPVPPRRWQLRSVTARSLRAAFIVFVILALGFGWRLAGTDTLIQEEGPGYWLGIIGGTVLLLQVAYPLRKRMRFMRRLGSVPVWFRLHMLLGILGPLIILYHSKFSLGAVNSNVALFTMLAVASSGLVGRYLYGKVHTGLHGTRASLHEMLEQTTPLLRAIESDVGGSGGRIAARLTEFAAAALAPRSSLWASLWHALRLGIEREVIRLRMNLATDRLVRANAGAMGWGRAESAAHRRHARLHVSSFVDTVAKASLLAFYERVFVLWHLFHLPLYCLLVATGIAHVVAVHLY